MGDLTKLSRRERQIMEVIYGRGEATVLQVQSGLEDAPSGMALRRMLSILEEKGYVKRRKEGREFVYMPVQARRKRRSEAWTRSAVTSPRRPIVPRLLQPRRTPPLQARS